MIRLRTLPITLVLALPLAAGCTARPAARADAKKPTMTQAATQSASVNEPVHLRMMPYAKRMAALPKDMPLQIPVMDGSVTETSAPVSKSSWMYTLETSGTVESVSHWYSHAYSSAGWGAASLAEFHGQSLTLHLQKNQAHSDLRFSPNGAGEVRVEVSIGLGELPPKVY